MGEGPVNGQAGGWDPEYVGGEGLKFVKNDPQLGFSFDLGHALLKGQARADLQTPNQL